MTTGKAFVRFTRLDPRPLVHSAQGRSDPGEVLGHLLIGHEHGPAGPEIGRLEGPRPVAHPPTGDHVVRVSEQEQVRSRASDADVPCVSRPLVFGSTDQAQRKRDSPQLLA